MSSNESVKNFSKHEMSIGGHSLTISSDQDKDKIELIAKLANQKLSYSLSNNISFQKSLMLSLLQACEEIIDLKSEMVKKVENLEDQTELILEKFHSSLS